MKTVSGVLFALLLVSFGQAQQRWTKTYGGTYDDYGYSVQQDSDSGYVITGYTTSFGAGYADVYLVKTDASGDTLWTRTFGGTQGDDGYSVKQTSDGGYIIAGLTYSFGAGGSDVYLIKTNASGDTLWTRTYGGTGIDASYCVQQTSDGGYIVAGQTNSFGADSQNVYLIKTNAAGDTLWTRTYGGNGNDWAYSVQQTSDSGYIIAATTSSFGVHREKVYLIKANASGDTLWTRTYGGTNNDYGYSVQQTSDGGYIVAGQTYSFGAGGLDVYLIKTNAHGDTLWTRTYGGTGDDHGFSVQQTPDGGYIIVGFTTSFGAGGEDVYLIGTNASGDTLWTRTFGGTQDEEARSVRQTLDGGYVIAAYTGSFGAGGNDVYVIKTDASGRLGVEEPSVSSEQKAVSRMAATPNPFASFTRIPGHEGERFEVYDASGKMVGAYRGSRIGEGLLPAVYFIKLDDGQSRSLRIVKVR